MKIISFVAYLLISISLIAQVSFVSRFNGLAKAGQKGEIEVQINRHTINSFAKYQLEIPDGISISELDSKGGNFSIEGKKVKIIWINLPSEKQFTIKLKIRFNEDVNFPITLYQKFYYLENSVKKEVLGEPLVINASESIAIEVNKENTSLPTITISNTASATAKSENNSTPILTSNKSKEISSDKTNLPTDNFKPINVSENKTNSLSNVSQDAYTYKIQIAASAIKPNEEIFLNAGKVIIEQHKGLYKVLIDKTFKTKEEALQYREQLIQKGYTGAFLVKYLNGQRVN